MSDTFRSGLTRSAGLAASTLVLGVSFGALARRHGWGEWLPVLSSAGVFSGSAQFAVLTALSNGGIAAAVTSGALINLRFLAMSLAITPELRGGRVRRAAEAQAVVDGSWVLAHDGHGRFKRGVLFGSAAAQWPAWVTGTALGVLVAPSAHTLNTTGLDAIFPAFFAVLLFDQISGDRVSAIVATAAATVVALSLLVLSPGLAIVAAASTALFGLRTKDRHG